MAIYVVTFLTLNSMLMGTALFALIETDRTVVLLLYVNHLLSFSIIGQVPELELLTISINSYLGKILIAQAYRPPSTSPVFYFSFLNRVLSGFNTNLFSNFLLWVISTQVSLLVTVFLLPIYVKPLSFLGLHTVPTSYTRITDVSSSTLNIIATSVPNNIQSCITTFKLGSSDPQGLFSL